MQRGFLTPAAQHVSGEGGAHGNTRLATLREQLANAERELRRCRKERLDLEASLRDAEQASRAVVERLPPALSKEAVEALASHEEPPKALHCLAEVLILVVDGPLLVDLGEHPLPERVPWENLQVLLHKSWKKHDAAACVAALQQQPFGVRLKEHARERLCGSGVVKRESVAALDERCLPVLDFLLALLKPPRSTEDSRRQAMERSALERQRLSEAVVAHEREVALIRKKLQEVKRSEENAHAFAAKHAPRLVSSENCDNGSVARNPLIQVAALKEGCEDSLRQDIVAASGDDECGTLDTNCNNAVTCTIANSSGAAGTGSHVTALPRVAAARQSIQYRLNEVFVPQLQEPVLASLTNALVEQRGAYDRSLEISGFSDVREEPETGWRRAQAVVEFLESRGVPSERLNIVTGTVPPGNGGSREFVERCSTRRVDLVLFDGGESSDKSVRHRASEVFSRLFDNEAIPRPHDGNDEPTVASPQLPHNDNLVGAGQDVAVAEHVPQTSCAAGNDSRVANSKGLEDRQGTSNCFPAPAVSIEELSEGNCAVRALQVVFTLPGLNAADTSLDVGQEAVRLRSVSGVWPDVEAPLPFLVGPATEGAAKFSRKKGTLTLHLTAAQ